jgi:hypothetical protein
MRHDLGVAAVYQRHEFRAEQREALEQWGAHVVTIVAEASGELRGKTSRVAREPSARGLRDVLLNIHGADGGAISISARAYRLASEEFFNDVG